jgi:hypothetical protein
MAVTSTATPRPARLGRFGADLFEISREAGAAPADDTRVRGQLCLA